MDSKVCQSQPRNVQKGAEHQLGLPLQARLDTVDTFFRRMELSGYSREQVRQAVRSGLTSYKRKRESGDGSVFRSREQMDLKRNIRLMVEKTKWFQDIQGEPREKSSIPTAGGKHKKFQ